MNIFEKIAIIRVALQNANVKKTGRNAFAKFDYYTLEDFMPVLNKLMLDNKVCSKFSIVDEVAKLDIINSEKPEEVITFESPIASADLKGCTPIQSLGGVHTYMKRYLYQNAFEIVEHDLLDALVGTEAMNGAPKAKAPVKKASAQQGLDKALLDQALGLEIDLFSLATYLKKEESQLTNEDLKTAIARKQAFINKKEHK